MKESQLFSVRLPQKEYDWLQKYLETYSYGENRSEKFLHFVEEMQRLESQGITFVNLEGALKAARENVQKQEAIVKAQEPIDIDSIKEAMATLIKEQQETHKLKIEDLCLRYPKYFRTNTPEIKTAMCQRCEKLHKIEFENCKKLRENWN